VVAVANSRECGLGQVPPDYICSPARAGRVASSSRMLEREGEVSNPSGRGPGEGSEVARCAGGGMIPIPGQLPRM
jgi:hypothetical protein